MELHSRIDKRDYGTPSINVRNMDSGLFCSRALELDQSEQISISDMLASDKKILIYLVKQKDREIDHLVR